MSLPSLTAANGSVPSLMPTTSSPLLPELAMAGMSLTICKADDELIRLWEAPVVTHGLRWGA